jgi:glyoxylase-like metal-dependent hydrolase (beta-lactamase superfamily II)/8-oxo-dGTP pyrophosphatase MutT (NUDIX family)
LSESFPGLPPPPPPAKPRDAAAVILIRPAVSGVETFWIRRERYLSFAAGFYAFPGGAVDRQDAAVKVEGAEGEEAVLRAAAARELFEETGVLLAAGAQALSKNVRDEARRRLCAGERTFADFLTEHGLRLRASALRPAGRWITPPFLPKRFDARFFLAELPPDEAEDVWPGELAEGDWVAPKDALERWGTGSALLHPPNLHALQVLTSFTTLEDAEARLMRISHAPGNVPARIEFQRGVRVFPLETPTLPPATHTNCYVLGNGELLIVDPGAAEVRQYARLLALIAGYKAEGKRPLAVVLTHHHADHIGGAQAVKERLGIPLWCHERTADRLDFAADRLLKDGEVLSLAGMPSMKWRVLHTPGHARGHICLVDEASRAAVVGDMVAGVGSIVIDPPEGDMTDYLAQLKRLRELPVGALYAAHGPALPDGVSKLDEYTHHRAMRERRVLQALAANGSTIREVVAKAYDDTPTFLHPLAERSALAILIKLVREGKARRNEEHYAPAG